MFQSKKSLQNHNLDGEQEFTGRLDRFFIFIGENFVRFLPLIIFFGALGFIAVSFGLGSLVIVNEVGKRFQEIDAKNQQQQIFEEQQLDQFEAIQNKVVVPAPLDESGWFVILEDGELLELDESDIEPIREESSDWVDGSQQFTIPKLEPTTIESDIIDRLEEFATSN